VTLKRSLKVIQTGTIRKIGCSFLFAFHSNYMAVSLTVYEIFSIKEWHDLETGGRGGLRSLKKPPIDHVTFCWSAIVNIALPGTVLELFDVE